MEKVPNGHLNLVRRNEMVVVGQSRLIMSEEMEALGRFSEQLQLATLAAVSTNAATAAETRSFGCYLFGPRTLTPLDGHRGASDGSRKAL